VIHVVVRILLAPALFRTAISTNASQFRNEMDRYLLHEQLGDGTFGTVFRAVRIGDNKEVR
jgi:serine/threonine protein kinase